MQAGVDRERSSRSAVASSLCAYVLMPSSSDQQNLTEPAGSRQDHVFYARADACAAWLYPAAGDAAAAPIVVMAHGLSGTRRDRLGVFAERFASAGIAALVFDHWRHVVAIGEESRWRDRVSARWLLGAPFRPARHASTLHCPWLVCVGEADRVAKPGPAIAAARRAPLGALCTYPGVDHFDIYDGPQHEAVITDQLAFLRRHLLCEHG
jgi:pimeloyl-ACP methyl ester carboxylesterase